MNADFKSAKEYVEMLSTSDSPIVIFTAGAAGRNACRALSAHGVKTTCFADNSNEKLGETTVDEVVFEVIGFQDTISRYPDAYIIIPPRNYLSVITEQLVAAGYSREKLIALDFDVLNYNLSDKACERVYSLFSDERSRIIFNERLNYLRTGDISYLGKVRDRNQMYFDSDIISLSSSETVIDGGGYNGDTFSEFVKIVKTFKHYYLFEPDLENMNAAKNNLSALNNDFIFSSANLSFVPMGLWSQRDILSFSNAGLSGSRLAEYGETQIDVTSIDEVLSETAATFIKMDIEGAEIQALKGASMTIAKYKPKLAICAYHKVGDFIDIPLLIHEFNQEYRLFLRHYSTDRTDTVCYAV